MTLINEMWKSLFTKSPSAEDLKLQLKQIERDQKRKRRELDLKSEEKDDKLQEALEAKKKGKQEVVRDIFREMRQIETDASYIGKDLRRLSLAKMTLSSFQRKLETLQEHKDRRGLTALVMRFHSDQSLVKAIDGADVDDDTFGTILKQVLGEEEDAVVRDNKVKEDSGFAEFDRTLNDMLSGAEPDHEKLNRALQGESIMQTRHLAEDRI